MVFDRGNNSEDNIAFLEDDSLLTFAKSDASLLALEEKELGKTVLFTNRLDYTNEDIIKAYRSAWNVESSFKQMKNTVRYTLSKCCKARKHGLREHLLIASL